MKQIKITLFILTLLASSTFAQDEVAKRVVRGDTLYTVHTPDEIPSIMHPDFYQIEQADSFYYKNEPLIVVAEGNQAKAYSKWLLDKHEVVNDELNGRPLVISWSPLSYTGVVYEATVDNQVLTFRASGSLWKDAQVMVDEQTNSLWAQVSGVCIDGPLIGKKLKLFPVSHTIYATFQAVYLNGLLLKKTEKGPQVSGYDQYFFSADRCGIFGHAYPFNRIPPKELIFGIRLESMNFAITRDQLLKEIFYSIKFRGERILVIYDRASESVCAFKLKANRIKIEGNEIVADNNRWNAFSGKSIDGTVADLEPLPVITSFWFAWKNFFPDSRLIYKK